MHFRLVRSHHGVILVDCDELLCIAMLLCRKHHFQSLDLLFILQTLSLDLCDLILCTSETVQSVFPLGVHLQRLIHQVSAFRALVRDHFLQHGGPLRMRLLLNLLLKGHFLHRRLGVSQNAFEAHLVVCYIHQLALGGVHRQSGGLQLNHEILDLRHQRLLLLLQALPQGRLSVQLIVHAMYILSEIVDLHPHGSMGILQLLVILLQGV
mmetsp:Transcript_38815/g.83587  ORF Transcript_38815/g.83587 Transcript_38815/m.83587 type:complete len:209 (-) Transcript_38815:1664-2290(-)